MARYSKIDFSGGLNQRVDPSRVNFTAEYYALINARTRRNVLRPIYKPLEITHGLPASGILQGVYAINSYLVVFVNGKAYYRFFDPDSNFWTQITQFQMSSTEDRLYMELVPASTVNYVRKLATADDVSGAVKLFTQIAGTPQAAIVMDGVNRPWKIFPDTSAAQVGSYADWTTEVPEYVPIAKFPLFMGAKLYCVGKDARGSYNQIFHSVSGAPFNFVTAVTTTGDKISPVESEGGAQALAYNADFGETTALKLVRRDAGEVLYLSTIKNSHLVIPDFTRLIYGEPQFARQFLFSVGALNNESVIPDINGDTAVVHQSGIKTFNSILQFRNEGRNAPFSMEINDLLADLIQSSAASIYFDNYAVFAVNTRYGSAILWYDTLLQKWASIDQFDNVGAIKQFCAMTTRTTNKLFFITTDNRLFEYFGSTEVAPVKIYFSDLLPDAVGAEHRIESVQLYLNEVRSPGWIQTSILADKRLAGTLYKQLTTDSVTTTTNDPVPYPTSAEPVGQPITFDFRASGRTSRRTGPLIILNADADISGIEINTSAVTSRVQELEKPFSSPDQQPTTIIFIGNDGTTDSSRLLLQKQIKRANPDYIIGLGNHSLPSGSSSDIASKLTAYWGALRNLSKFYAVPGNVELSNDAGEPFFSALAQAPTRYFKLDAGFADLFLLNSGINTAGTQIEPDNLDGASFELSTQMQWLRGQLAASTKNAKIVVMCHPPYSSAVGDTPGFTTLRSTLLQSWGATALVSGKSAIYERLFANNLVHFVAGTGSATLGSVTTPLAQSEKRVTGVTGYLKMVVYPLSTLFQFVDANGTIYDEYLQ